MVRDSITGITNVTSLFNTPPPNAFIIIATIVSGGQNYQPNDVLEPIGSILFNVETVDQNGAITSVSIQQSFAPQTNPYPYNSLPPNPYTPGGGHGTGASFNLTYSTHIIAATGWYAPGYQFGAGGQVLVGAQSLMLIYNCCDRTTGAELPSGTYDVYFVGEDNQVPGSGGTPLSKLFPAYPWDAETNWLPTDCPGIGVLCVNIPE